MQPSGMRYIRDIYGVPAKRGMRVWWHAGAGKYGRILSADSGRLWIRFDGGKREYVHPTDRLTYFGLDNNYMLVVLKVT